MLTLLSIAGTSFLLKSPSEQHENHHPHLIENVKLPDNYIPPNPINYSRHSTSNVVASTRPEVKVKTFREVYTSDSSSDSEVNLTYRRTINYGDANFKVEELNFFRKMSRFLPINCG